MSQASKGSDSTAPKPTLNSTFWTLNVIEMWERLAFYNLRVMAPIYIMQADNPGGLHLTRRRTRASSTPGGPSFSRCCRSSPAGSPIASATSARWPSPSA